MMKEILYKPIGIIHTPFKDVKEMPIQPIGAKGIQGTIKVDPEYADGIKDLEGFSHMFLIYHFHLSQGYSLHIKPFMDDDLHGVFATRAPKRPNPIGISVVRLIRVDEAILHIEDVIWSMAPHAPDIGPARLRRSDTDTYGSIATVDYLLESVSAATVLVTGLGRFVQDLLLWSTSVFDTCAWATASSSRAASCRRSAIPSRSSTRGRSRARRSPRRAA